jgi:hypothetical protein
MNQSDGSDDLVKATAKQLLNFLKFIPCHGEEGFLAPSFAPDDVTLGEESWVGGTAGNKLRMSKVEGHDDPQILFDSRHKEFEGSLVLVLTAHLVF